MRNSFKLVSAFYCRLISVSKQEISPADERAYLQSDGHFYRKTFSSPNYPLSIVGFEVYALQF